VVVHFDDALRQTPYDAFVRAITARVRLAGILMTPDAAFGHERRGTPEALAALGRTLDPPVDVVVVPPFVLDGRPVRSSDVRAAIGSGRLGEARRLLGRRHAVTGTPDAAGRMAFATPVALPPPGPYVAAVGRAWSLDASPVRERRTSIVDVEGPSVVLPAARRGSRRAGARGRVAIDREAR
jgi:hypothetical protein